MEVDTMEKQIKEVFERKFGTYPQTRYFFSPGRVNLIGEHIDYNGGHVFPVAIGLGNYGAIRLNETESIRLYSHNFQHAGIIEVPLDGLEYNSSHGWANYVKGIVKEFIDRGYLVNSGFDIAIYGDLPGGAGLSSSASIELLIALMMNNLFNLDVGRTDLALLSKKVENEYLNVKCGIMDQFAIINGKKDHAIFLDTNSLVFTHVPMQLEGYDIVICNSKVTRGLSDSKYNKRKEECDLALSILKQELPVKNLCEITYPEFVRHRHLLKDPILLKRAQHVITENQRTLNSYRLLVENDIISFGEMLLESHYSLRNDYEVSCDELDTLVELATNSGSVGSRMTGAGFGGCTVNIVPSAIFPTFKDNVAKGYRKKYGLEPDILIANPEDGTKEI
jgi:galactokinase